MHGDERPKRSKSRRSKRLASCFATTILVLLATAPFAALGATIFPLSHSFGPLDTNSRVGLGVGSVAVDSDGYVYVLEAGANRVRKFDSLGNAVSFSALGSPPGSSNVMDGNNNGIDDPDAIPREGFGFDSAFSGNDPATIAVDNSGGPRDGWIYTTDPSRRQVWIFDPSGTFRGSNSSGRAKPVGNENRNCGVAVDAHGFYYTAHGPRVDKWQPNGEDPAKDIFVAQLQRTDNYDEACGIAVDSEGNVFTVDNYGQDPHEVVKYAANQFSSRTGDEAVGTFIGTEALSLFVDPTNDHLYSNSGTEIAQFDALGNPAGPPIGAGQIGPSGSPSRSLSVQGDYVYAAGNGVLNVFGPPKIVPETLTEPATPVGRTTATLNGYVDPVSGGTITDCRFEYGIGQPSGTSVPCVPASPLSSASAVSADISGLSTETTYVFKLVASNANGAQIGRAMSFTPRHVLGLETDEATDITMTSAKLNGSFDPAGENTKYVFQWGIGDFSTTTPPLPGAEVGGTGTTSVSVDLGGLQPGATYQYRLVGFNGHGASIGFTRSFTASTSPTVTNTWVTDVVTDGALLKATINPNGVQTSYFFEYGPNDSYGSRVPLGDRRIPEGVTPKTASVQLSGLTQDTAYHYRVVAKNARGTTLGPDRVFRTYSFDADLVDPCPNSLARRQTGAALLLDCRAYELVSATDTSGYDVESDLVSTQEPYGGYPAATGPSKALYALHSGALSGVGNPTNYGPDPYLSTRTSKGWVTSYVGIEADDTPTTFRFASTLAEASPRLESFAFGGPEICSPCFADGKTGIPVRLPSGELVQGMAGSIDPGPGADAEILVRKRFSADARYLIFGSTSQFEPDAPDGAPAIYRRDLREETTEVVSKDEGGDNIDCLSACASKGVAGLDVSEDGSRILIGQLLGTDAAGNDFWHPYLNVAGASPSIDLAPDTTTGVSYAGMSSDGAQVLFTSVDQLTTDDADDSVDLFLATVVAGQATLIKLSPGDAEDCDPVANAGGAHWNSVTATASCSVVAIAGAGGVGAGDGSVYFLSPEQLTAPSEAVQDQPNLYALAPGLPLRFVATLEPNNPVVLNAVNDTEIRRSADFQITPDGGIGAFASTLSLSGHDNAGFSEVFRYHPGTEKLDCASCAITGAQSSSDSTMAANGRSITDDGRVFFTTASQLVLRDNNQRRDAYEWSGGVNELISSGIAPNESGLLSVTADGTDAYFFTRDTLVSEDHNGVLMKLYDAREKGGFFILPEPKPCAASDECHGPSSLVAPPPQIGTNAGTGGNHKAAPKSCPGRKVKWRGRCVRLRRAKDRDQSNRKAKRDRRTKR